MSSEKVSVLADRVLDWGPGETQLLFLALVLNCKGTFGKSIPILCLLPCLPLDEAANLECKTLWSGNSLS